MGVPTEGKGENLEEVKQAPPEQRPSPEETVDEQEPGPTQLQDENEASRSHEEVERAPDEDQMQGN